MEFTDRRIDLVGRNFSDPWLRTYRQANTGLLFNVFTRKIVPLVQRVIEKRRQARVGFRASTLMPDGSVKHVHVIGRPLTIDSANEVEFVGTVMDVTDEKEGIRRNQSASGRTSEREYRAA